MKRILFSLVCLIFFNACDLGYNPHKIYNIYDPDDPNFIPPTLDITNGPESGSTIDNYHVTFSWQGNDTHMTYATNFDNYYFKNWFDTCSISYRFLEPGDHTFSVYSRYRNKVSMEYPVTINFTIKPFTDQSLYFIPSKVEILKGNSFSIQLMGHNFQSVSKMNISLKYDTKYLAFQRFKNNNNSFIKSTDSFDIDVDENKGEVSIILSSTTGLVNSGEFVYLGFTSKNISTTEIQIAEIIEFINTSNESMNFTNIENCIVYIK